MRRHSRLARQVAVCGLTSQDTKSRKDTSEPKEAVFGPRYGEALNQLSPALATALGAPQGAIPARAAIRSMTGIGVYDSDSDKEGGRLTMTDVKKGAKRALSYAKRRGILTDVVDSGEKFLLSKATKPEHENLIKTIRGEVRRRYGVGITKPKRKKFAKGSQEAKDHMAKIRSMRKSGGSFRL